MAKTDPYKLVGTQLSSGYLIEEFVTHGGMSFIYKGRFQEQDETVAIKVIKPELFDSSNTLFSKLFKYEVAITKKLQHPNIVRTRESGVEQGLAYLVMDWLSGHTLLDELGQSGQMSLLRATHILEQVCSAIEFAHKQKVLHLDLKPSNIFLVATAHAASANNIPIVKVIDFGLARLMQSTAGTTLSRYLGTPNYSAPEMFIEGRRATYRCDIYSLGTVAYELLTGTTAFSVTQAVLRSRVPDMPPPSLLTVRPDIPPMINDVLTRAMSSRSESRQSTVAEFFREFQRASKTGPIAEAAASLSEVSSGSKSAKGCVGWLVFLPSFTVLILVTLGADRIGLAFFASLYFLSLLVGSGLHWMLLDDSYVWELVPYGAFRRVAIPALEPTPWRPLIFGGVVFILSVIIRFLFSWITNDPPIVPPLELTNYS